MIPLKLCCSIFFFFVFFLQIFVLGLSIGSDFDILIRVKNHYIDDPDNTLKDWVRNGDQNPCNWTGITCDNKNHSVTAIDLSGLGISGTLPFDFCRIRTLKNLSLQSNNIEDSVSSNALSLCSRLQLLNLSTNDIVGNLPEFTLEFTDLRVLDLSYNNFSGAIPASFGWLPSLQVLNLIQNLLNESIPSFLGNLTELTRLELAYNPFEPSILPPEFGNLSKLENLYLTSTNLIGTIPDSIGKLISLKNLDLCTNSLSGKIPITIGELRNVEQMVLFENQFYGELPESIGNLTNLLQLDVSQNNLRGKLPENVAALHLESLNLNDNLFEGEVPEILASNPNLVELKLFNNSFTGRLPKYLGQNSDLTDFDISTNNFNGELPKYLCHRKKLERLISFGSGFSGKLPESLGECDSLSYVRIENNRFSGEVPNGFWSLPLLEHFQLSNNAFEGSIPTSIPAARGITDFLISGNNFSGPLPAEICRLHEVVRFEGSRNKFSGELPSCITNLKKLQNLELQENTFSGDIPRTVRSWIVLTALNLSGNRFSGQIPPRLGDLPALTHLDLSRNLLSGKIPPELTKLKLDEFNLSDNELYGKIPSGFDRERFVSSLMGNPNLCSPDLKPIRLCPASKRATSNFVVIVLAVCVLLLIGSLLWFIRAKWHLSPLKRKSAWKVTQFQRVGFNEKDMIPQLTNANLIGSGGSGSVYKVQLRTGDVVAAKRLWVGQREMESESVFRSEVETLGRIRHSNVIKLLFSCSGPKGGRILVYEYMENGSLGDVLHGEKSEEVLDWERRLNIAVGAAQGLAYLHHDCIPTIVHRDVKSNNILLDGEFVPRVADFGLAKTLQREASDGGNMSCVAGSYGYIAPEYGYTMKVTEKSDVYSFGVLLMELVTGKRPNDFSFGEEKDIVKWVKDLTLSSSSCEERSGIKEVSSHLIDPRMEPLSPCDLATIEKVLDVALLCTSPLPVDRPTMRRVVELLNPKLNWATSQSSGCH